MNLHKTFSCFTTMVTLALFSGCAPQDIYKSNRQKTPVTIDGKTNDWEVPLRFFDSKTKLNYTVTNDADNLYICIRATDDDNVSGITRRGLQIWIDTTGKKNHQVGILCPIPKKNESSSAGNGGRHQGGEGENSGDNSQQQLSPYTGVTDTARLNRIHRHFIESAKEMHVSGFKTVPDGILELPNMYGINIGVSWDNSNVLVYEVAIPFKSFFKYPLLLSDSSRVINISFNFTITPKRTGGGGGYGGSGGGMGRGMGGGGMGGGMGGMGGGMGGGRHGGGGGGGGAAEPEPESIWTAFHLATK
ncbi:MAG: hypothetical protein ACLQQ4_06950 [Bacteroidia bacterium]